MKLLRGIDSIHTLRTDIVATIGNFDGVHSGHQALLASLKTEANKRQLPCMVVLFEPQPAEYFFKDKGPARLLGLREKLERLKAAKVDYVFCLRFNEAIANTSADTFANQVLFTGLRIRYLMVGQDFRFGQQRLGDVALLQTTATQYGAEVACFPDVMTEGERVSSTAIRQALAVGNFSQVTQALGYPYSLSGTVIHGSKVGTTWGIPTANVALKRHKPALTGVFLVEVQLPNEPFRRPAVANIGCRPTLKGQTQTLEVHLLGYQGDLYGKRMTVIFIEKCRDEKKFESLDALIAQIKADIAYANQFFTETVA